MFNGTGMNVREYKAAMAAAKEELHRLHVADVQAEYDEFAAHMDAARANRTPIWSDWDGVGKN